MCPVTSKGCISVTVFQSPIKSTLYKTHCPGSSSPRHVGEPSGSSSLVSCSPPTRPTISREKCLVVQSLSCPQTMRVRLSPPWRHLLNNSCRYPRQTPAATATAAGATTTTKATSEKGTACPRGGIIGRGERGRLSRGSCGAISKGTVESTEAWWCR